MNYQVTITETLQRKVSVEAPSPQQAERVVTERYRSCDIVLDDGDFQGVELRVETTRADYAD